MLAELNVIRGLIGVTVFVFGFGAFFTLLYILGWCDERRKAKWRAEGYEEPYPGAWSHGDALIRANFLELDRQYYERRRKSAEKAIEDKQEALQRKWAV